MEDDTGSLGFVREALRAFEVLALEEGTLAGLVWWYSVYPMVGAFPSM